MLVLTSYCFSGTLDLSTGIAVQIIHEWFKVSQLHCRYLLNASVPSIHDFTGETYWQTWCTVPQVAYFWHNDLGSYYIGLARP